MLSRLSLWGVGWWVRPVIIYHSLPAASNTPGYQLQFGVSHEQNLLRINGHSSVVHAH